MFGKNRSRFILVIGDDGVWLMPHKVSAMRGPLFAAIHDGRGEKLILDVLARYAHIPLLLLINTLAQDIRHETLPRLNPFDRARLIRRRREQSFGPNVLSASLNLDWTHVLIAGLHENNVISHWLDRVKARAPQIGLLPIEAAPLISRLAPEGEWTLLMARMHTGGMRQIVTHKGELIFTRLTPETESIARDISASLGYLARAGLADSHDLRIMLLTNEMDDSVRELPVHSVKHLTPAQAVRKLGLTNLQTEEPYADLLFASFAASRPRLRLPLAPPHIKSLRAHDRIRRWGHAAAFAALALVIAMAGWDGIGLLQDTYDNYRRTSHLAALKQELAAQRAEAAPVTEPLGKLRAALQRQRLFAEASPTPWLALRELSGALGDRAQLVRVDWQNGSDKEPGEALTVSLRLKSDAATSREEAVDQVKSLAQLVARAMPNYAVDIARYPFPALPQEALTNSGTQKQDGLADLHLRKVKS